MESLNTKERAIITLNGNVMCSIDVETTGLVAGYHEITQVCFLPLDKQMKVRRDIVPFDLWLKIEHEDRISWDALRVSKTNFFKHQQLAIDKWTAVDMFEDWITKLKLPPNKRISPLAHNWPFDRGFIQEWLCPKTFDLHMDGRFRDTMAMALGINDIYEFRHEPIPFAKVNLAWLCKTLKTQHKGDHSALGDCIATSDVYLELVKEQRYLTGTIA